MHAKRAHLAQLPEVEALSQAAPQGSSGARDSGRTTRQVLSSRPVGVRGSKQNQHIFTLFGTGFTEQGAALFGVFGIVLTILLFLWFER